MKCPRLPDAIVAAVSAADIRAVYQHTDAGSVRAYDRSTHHRAARRPSRTPATLTGVSGRPTLACALSTTTKGPSLGDQSIDAKVPKAKAAVANNACLTLICLIATSYVEHANDNDRWSAGLRDSVGWTAPAETSLTESRFDQLRSADQDAKQPIRLAQRLLRQDQQQFSRLQAQTRQNSGIDI
jgi:hypothetical protein